MTIDYATDHPGERALQFIRVTGTCPHCDGAVTTTRGDADHIHHRCSDCHDEWVVRR